MKVTPITKKFGKYSPGQEFELPDKAAKVFIKVGKLKAVNGTPVYENRMMTTAPVVATAAPWGYKADGTPRARPGRPAKAE